MFKLPANTLGFLINGLRQLISPPLCTFCLAPDRCNRWLCLRCQEQLQYNVNPCYSCASPMPSIGFADTSNSQLQTQEETQEKTQKKTKLKLLCGHCLMNPFPFTWCFVPFIYTQSVRQWLIDFKEHKKIAFGVALTHLALDYIQANHNTNSKQHFPFNREYIIVPIPSSVGKIAKRGYNPALEIALEISHMTGQKLRANLLQVREHESQKGKSASIRKKYKVPIITQSVPPKILLVDDVMTTGSTLKNTAMMLLKNGCTEVSSLALARTPFG